MHFSIRFRAVLSAPQTDPESSADSNKSLFCHGDPLPHCATRYRACPRSLEDTRASPPPPRCPEPILSHPLPRPEVGRRRVHDGCALGCRFAPAACTWRAPEQGRGSPTTTHGLGRLPGERQQSEGNARTNQTNDNAGSSRCRESVRKWEGGESAPSDTEAEHGGQPSKGKMHDSGGGQRSQPRAQQPVILAPLLS